MKCLYLVMICLNSSLNCLLMPQYTERLIGLDRQVKVLMESTK